MTQGAPCRLAEFRIDLPLLRERRPDIPLLAQHFMADITGNEPQFTGSFMEALLRHPWPMNVRELRSVIQRLVVMGDESEALRATNLPSPNQPESGGPRHETRELESDARRLSRYRGAPSLGELKEALAELGGNVAEIARKYYTSRSQVYRWLKKYDLSPEDFRD